MLSEFTLTDWLKKRGYKKVIYSSPESTVSLIFSS